jgi:hypothetical protein
MANIPVNSFATAISGSGSITGSYGGFTAIQTTTFTSLKDGNNYNIANGGLTVAAGTTVPLLVTSASVSSGQVIFYI